MFDVLICWVIIKNNKYNQNIIVVQIYKKKLVQNHILYLKLVIHEGLRLLITFKIVLLKLYSPLLLTMIQKLVLYILKIQLFHTEEAKMW